MQQDSAEEREPTAKKKIFFRISFPSSRSILGSDAQKYSNVPSLGKRFSITFFPCEKCLFVTRFLYDRDFLCDWHSVKTRPIDYSSQRLEIWWQLHRRGKIILFGNENRVTPLVRDLPILLSRRDVWWLTPSPRDVSRPLFWPVAFADIHEQQRRVSQELGKESTRDC